MWIFQRYQKETIKLSIIRETVFIHIPWESPKMLKNYL